MRSKGSYQPIMIASDEDVLSDGSSGPRRARQSDGFVLYPQRFAMLFLFCLFSVVNANQWIQFASVENVACEYFGVSATAVNWMSMIYMLLYIPGIAPATAFVERRGLRAGILLGAALNLLGSVLRWLGTSQGAGYFWLVMVGQSTCSIAQLFVLGVPPMISAAWFGKDERATATAVAVLANQMGGSTGLVSAAFVDDGPSLTKLCLYTAVYSAALVLVLLGCFRGEPPSPPSASQAAKRGRKSAASGGSGGAAAGEAPPVLHPRTVDRISPPPPGGGGAQEELSVGESMRLLRQNRAFLMLLCAYSCSTGVYYGLATFVNSLLIPRFGEGEMSSIGWLGFTMVAIGVPGALISGTFLDRTKRYHFTVRVLFVLSTLSTAAFAVAARWLSFSATFAAAAVFGFFSTGVLAAGFEFGAELAFPVAESVSAGALNAGAQAAGVVFISALQPLFLDGRPTGDLVGPFYTNVSLTCAMLFGALLVMVTGGTLSRIDAEAAL